MQKIIYDVECFPNVFLCSIKDYDTKEVTVWEISDRVNDIEKINSFFKTFNGFLVSFNGIHYDNCMILWLRYNGTTTIAKQGILPLLQKLKEWNDFIIKNDFWYHDKKLSKYKYQNQWVDVDLYCYWSKGLRLSKKISLKGLAVQLNYSIIQELPYPHSMSLNHTQIDELIHYNSVHDLSITELLLSVFEGKSKIPLGNLGTIALRSSVKRKYGLTCLSWDAPKLASEVMLMEYAKRTNQEIKNVKKLRFDKDCFQFKDLLKDQKFNFTTKQFIDIYNTWMNCHNTYNNQFVAFTKDKEIGHKISIGVGGIHSIVKNKIYHKEKDYELWDIDIESLYPTFILGLHCFRFKELEETYADFKHLRVTESKPNVKKYKGTDKEQFWKNEDAFYKVILNGISGHIDQEYSPLYNNTGAMKMRCMGQLVLLVMVEKILQYNIEVIQINTDGITVKIHNKDQEWFKNMVIESEKEFSVKFEYGYYKKMILLNVNSYLAVDTNDKIKQKGVFVTNPELGNSVDFLIIPKALNAYYILSTPVKDFVLNHTEIYDFCCSMKVGKQFNVYWTSSKFIKSKQQRLNRFYASIKEGYIVKEKEGKEHHILKDSGVMIYNNHQSVFPTDINYQFYINKINEIIDQLNEVGQLKMF